MNWVHDVVNAHSESEAPAKFFYWSALAAMSAVIKKNIFLDRYEFKVYPNIYVFLIAKSGMKKGIPIALSKRLVEGSEAAHIIAGRNSMPRLLMDLGKMTTNSNGSIKKLAQSLIVSGELASFLVKDPDALTVLTDLYNVHEHEEKWVNSLKGTGVDTLLEPCITLLGATNEEHFINAVPQADIKGGFIARTFIVYSNEKKPPNSLVYKPNKILDDKKFVPFLKELAKLKGEFKWTKETGDFFHEWYTDFANNLPDDTTGTYNRIDTGIIKVAMLLSLSKNLELKMDIESLKEAKAQCLDCALGAKQVSIGGISTFSAQLRMVMNALIRAENHKLTRTQILRKFTGDIDLYSLDVVVGTLEASNIIIIVHNGSEVTYTMKKAIVDEFMTYAKQVK